MGRSQYQKRSHDLAWLYFKRGCSRWSFLAKASEIAGHVASFASWQTARGLDAGAIVSRDRLWRLAMKHLQAGAVTVLEFGVASGDTTRHWLSMLQNPELRWHGFDTFTGLPEPWVRGGIEFAKAGTFDAGGMPPSIIDTRLTWHVGLIEGSLPTVEIDFSSPLCVLFDLDLYGPSSLALDWLTPHLKPGDLLYFDEAYDPWHERRLLDEFLDCGHHVQVIGSTGMAIMLRYVGAPMEQQMPADRPRMLAERIGTGVRAR